MKSKIDMTLDEIEKLCGISYRLPRHSNWTAEVYGFGKWIRKYAYYPNFLPLCIHTDHGPGQQEFPLKTELGTTSKYMFYHSERLRNEWVKISKKSCFNYLSPFVFYRKINNIIQEPEAEGTLAFPAHSISTIDDISDIELYIKELLKLPEEYHPISACIHIEDLKKGMHKKFMEYKIPVYSAGSPFDNNFTERFYDILKKFKYTTSNLSMSCLYYSVEMGIPHFLYGPPPININKGDPNFELGPTNATEFKQRIFLKKLFSGPNMKISEEQKKVVENELGIMKHIGRFKMCILLYDALIYFMYNNAKHIVKTFLLRMIRKNSISN